MSECRWLTSTYRHIDCYFSLRRSELDMRRDKHSGREHDGSLPRDHGVSCNLQRDGTQAPEGGRDIPPLALEQFDQCPDRANARMNSSLLQLLLEYSFGNKAKASRHSRQIL